MPHPYRHLPPSAFWRSGVAAAGAAVDPVTAMPFAIAPGDAVASAGSCFAQHLAPALEAHGRRLLRTEPGAAPFSAAHGHIYTARQLRALAEEAFGLREPAERVWRRPDGAFLDAVRPRFAAFDSAAAVLAAREAHLGAVREVFEACDVLVFTLGLAEAWTHAADGAAFPLAPGILGAGPDPAAYALRSFSVAEVRDDLLAVLDLLRGANPAARCVLTVSPVPLAATATGAHVLAASTLGKAVLRTAVEEAVRSRDCVAYFPAYEIIAGPQARGRFFGPDARSVTAEGVQAVMALFARHLLRDGAAPTPAPAAAPPPDGAPGDGVADAEFARLQAQLCEEDALDPHGPDVGAAP
jgi:hypothetical protein